LVYVAHKVEPARTVTVFDREPDTIQCEPDPTPRPIEALVNLDLLSIF
jgi:hypothetical protein